MSLYSVLDSSSSPRASKKKAQILTPNAHIKKRIDVNPGLVILEIEPDGWAFEPFKSGQFIKVGLEIQHDDVDTVSLSSYPTPSEKSLKRAYSIISSPSQRESVEVLINLVPDGDFTPSLWRLEPGSRVYVDQKIRGTFTTEDVTQDSRVLLVATGTGIAPFRSMILSHFQENRIWKEVKVIHSVRHKEDLAFREEFERYAREFENFTYLPIVTRPEDSGWKGESRHIQKVLSTNDSACSLDDYLDVHNDHVFLCGNPLMIKSVSELFLDKGFKKAKAGEGTLHFERYWK
jgi:ferredoxin--NADP+ reductase